MRVGQVPTSFQRRCEGVGVLPIEPLPDPFTGAEERARLGNAGTRRNQQEQPVDMLIQWERHASAFREGRHRCAQSHRTSVSSSVCSQSDAPSRESAIGST